MSLFIQNSSGTLGTGGISALNAFTDLMIIVNGDTSLGQATVAGRPELEQVTYSPQNDHGIPANRIFLLVNTQFNLNPQHIDIIILACGSDFTLADGMLVTQFGGVTLPPGATDGSGVVVNPTASSVVVYDTSQSNGQGYCAKPQNGSDLNLKTPDPVILYHELSHAFRQATHATLTGVETDCASASPEESAAETDENDMRDQLTAAAGQVPGPGTRRDTGNHCGANCGATTTCCIVASIATGSPYSQEVQALRHVRDEFVRRSTIGFDFFERLHHDYYDFSPRVCRLMAQYPETRRLIEDWFVRPLVCCLQLISAHTLEGCPAAQLGTRFAAGLAGLPYLASCSRRQLAGARDLIQGHSTQAVPQRFLAEVIESKALPSNYIRWALMEPLDLYVEALVWRQDGRSAEDIGAGLAAAIDGWGARLPIAETWDDLSNRGFREELHFLSASLLRSPSARQAFALRLPAHLRRTRERQQILADAGFGKESQS